MYIHRHTHEHTHKLNPLVCFSRIHVFFKMKEKERIERGAGGKERRKEKGMKVHFLSKGNFPITTKSK